MPTIQCPTCEGKGEIPLPDCLREVLALVGRKPITSETIKERLHPVVERTAINNRLERLREAGYVQRQRNGKWWQYFRTNKSK